MTAFAGFSLHIRELQQRISEDAMDVAKQVVTLEGNKLNLIAVFVLSVDQVLKNL